MNLIAAVDRNWAIGRDGRLLVSIPSDKETFRRETVGKAVIMGRKTLESLPGGQPLAKRTNVVLSRDPDFRMKGAVVCGSVEEALEAVSGFAPEDVFVIGGQETYADGNRERRSAGKAFRLRAACSVERKLTCCSLPLEICGVDDNCGNTTAL